MEDMWHGGMWEKLIAVMKSSMKKVIGKSLVSRQELQTLITQMEVKMNDRPLTYISDDPNDLRPLSPYHLLRGFRLTDFPTQLTYDEISDPTFQSHSRLTDRQQRINSFLSIIGNDGKENIC